MEVIGAINLYNGQCIDSLDPDYNIVESCEPIKLAIKWNNIGVNWIHLVDVNGFRENNPVNLDVIKDIISKVHVPIQVAAGIQDWDVFEDILAVGAGRIVLDNSALKNMDFIKKVLKDYPDKTVILFNVDSGMTKIDENYHENIIDIINNLKNQGLQRVIYHDTSENYEFNYDDLLALARNTQLPTIATGKLKNLESIKKFKQMASCEKADIEGIILSKPLYDNTLDLYEVIKLIDAYPYIGDFYSREDIC
ncbi:MAG: hypothetical protein ACD_20C00429G0005 [uncultured bacterium]|nr:MAG: hypothetical protein ACD_20C00429G0005 [uncultured bacterium]